MWNRHHVPDGRSDANVSIPASPERPFDVQRVLHDGEAVQNTREETRDTADHLVRHGIR